MKRSVDSILTTHAGSLPRPDALRDGLATTSGCSTTLVAWLTTPGMRILPSGNFTSRQTLYSCSCRTLPASTE